MEDFLDTIDGKSKLPHKESEDEQELKIQND